MMNTLTQLDGDMSILIRFDLNCDPKLLLIKVTILELICLLNFVSLVNLFEV